MARCQCSVPSVDAKASENAVLPMPAGPSSRMGGIINGLRGRSRLNVLSSSTNLTTSLKFGNCSASACNAAGSGGGELAPLGLLAKSLQEANAGTRFFVPVESER